MCFIMLLEWYNIFVFVCYLFENKKYFDKIIMKWWEIYNYSMIFNKIFLEIDKVKKKRYWSFEKYINKFNWMDINLKF